MIPTMPMALQISTHPARLNSNVSCRARSFSDASRRTCLWSFSPTLSTLYPTITTITLYDDSLWQSLPPQVECTPMPNPASHRGRSTHGFQSINQSKDQSLQPRHPHIHTDSTCDICKSWAELEVIKGILKPLDSLPKQVLVCSDQPYPVWFRVLSPSLQSICGVIFKRQSLLDNVHCARHQNTYSSRKTCSKYLRRMLQKGYLVYQSHLHPPTISL